MCLYDFPRYITLRETPAETPALGELIKQIYPNKGRSTGSGITALTYILLSYLFPKLFYFHSKCSLQVARHTCCDQKTVLNLCCGRWSCISYWCAWGAPRGTRSGAHSSHSVPHWQLTVDTCTYRHDSWCIAAKLLSKILQSFAVCWTCLKNRSLWH